MLQPKDIDWLSEYKNKTHRLLSTRDPLQYREITCIPVY